MVRDRRVPSVSSRASTMKWVGSFRSHLGRDGTELTESFLVFCTTLVSKGSFISGILSTGKTVNRFWFDNGGVRFTRCRGENPLPLEEVLPCRTELCLSEPSVC